MIKLFIIRIILFFTWFNSLGFHIRYRLKKMGFINRGVGWTITLFKSFDNPVKKNWKKTSNTVATRPTVGLPSRLRIISGTVMLPDLRAT